MQNCPTNLRSLALASVPVLATMAPKHNKGVTVSLHELHQELGADSVQSSLPSQSSGVEREGPGVLLIVFVGFAGGCETSAVFVSLFFN